MSLKFGSKRKITRALSLLGLLVVFSFFGRFSGLFEAEKDQNCKEAVLNPIPLGCIYKGKLSQNEPLALSLSRKGLSQRLIYQLTSSLKEKFNLKRSLPGDEYTLVTTPDSILYFEYQNGMRQKIKVIREEGKLKAELDTLYFNCLIKSLQGEIKSSLWESMIDRCESPELIMKFTEVFEWEIDFLTEPRGGDTFRLIFEEYYKDGNFVKYGDILAAEYNLSGQLHQAVLYQNPEGKKGYFDPTGQSVRKAFLKSPLNYRRISSRFSYSRFHPIFKRYRPHLGVDYAAPIGTPVVASGDGVVVFAGWRKGFGKIIEIRHPNGFVTTYGHLLSFARGIRKGTKVKQKQLIGYVGSTGCSTGPHLDYRVKANGRFVNPLRMVAPPLHPVKREYLADFQAKRDNLLYALDLLAPRGQLAWSNEHK